MISKSRAYLYASILVALMLSGAVVGNELAVLNDIALPRPGRPDREALEQPRGVLESVAPIAPPADAAPADAAPAALAAKDSDKKDDEDDKDDDDEKKPEGLFGERFHGRNGISAEYIYTGDFFDNTRGGIRTGASYRGLFELVLQADLEKMEVGPGGKIFIDGQQGHGRGFTERYVGDAMWMSNIDWHDMTQVSEYWYEKVLLDKKLTCRLGKIDCNSEFGVVDLGGDFIHSAFGVVPTVPMPTFPNASAAVELLYKPNEHLDFKVGIWDGNPNGETWGFSDTGITFTIGEVKYRYDLAEEKGLPGDFHAGIWHHSGPWDDLRLGVGNSPLGGPSGSGRILSTRDLPFGALAPRRGNVGTSANGNTVNGNHGIYLGADQLLFKEVTDDEKDTQGLGVFAQYGWAPEERNWGHQYYGGGIVYRGLLGSRDEDVIGVGVAHLVFSRFLAATQDETAIELFYMAQITKWMKLQPDLQYIVNPGGVYADALVAGMRFEVVF